MIRKLLGTVVVMMIGINFVAAVELDGILKRVEEPKKPGEGKVLRFNAIQFKGDQVYMSKILQARSVTKDVKIVMGKYNEAEKKWEPGEAIEGGLDAAIFKDPGNKTVHVRLTVRDDGKAVTQILVRQIGGTAKR